MKPKPTIDPNAAGDEVKRLLAEDGTASVALKDLRSAKATRKEALKSALTVVWEAFESGQTVNGYATRKEWAKNFAGVAPRTCEHIIYGRKRGDANHGSRVTTLKPGTVFKVEGSHFIFEIPQKDKNDPDTISSISKLRERDKTPGNPYFGQKFTNVTLHGVRLVEDKPESKSASAPKKKERLRHIPDLRLVTKVRASLHGRSLCDVSLNGNNAPTKREPANCPKCLELAKSIDNKLMVPAVTHAVPEHQPSAVTLAEVKP